MALQFIERYSSTISGTDKLFMLVEFACKVFVSKSPDSIKANIQSLSSNLSDVRVQLRYTGLASVLLGFGNLQKQAAKPSPFLILKFVENFMNLLYFPMEHICWLASHKIINVSKETQDYLGLLSSRVWLVSVLLYYIHLFIDLKRISPKNPKEAEKEQRRILLEGLINSSYLPMALHYGTSIKFPNSVNHFGLLAAILENYKAISKLTI
eukprot:TRINITY_DN26695_c0_g1_i1.p1 TRINITY_DN26695_c0_g1~~TRINITY_DN26695_c0_g1_i1.p1  ORF type:complete len:210 (-),score=55.43 TRINITY_DN26695_c0_g1_i1:7-636(-)